MRVFRAAVAGPRFIALLTQESGKSGWSLTNGIESAVSQACCRYGFGPAELWWIEHYDDRGASSGYRQVLEDACERTEVELFRRVTFAGLDAPNGESQPRFPRWMAVSKTAVEAWIGHLLP